MTKTKSDMRKILEAWILNLERNSGLDEIDPNEDLVESGLIDSLDFINFLYIIEEQRGSGIQASILKFENFRTLNLILDNFF